MPEYEFDCNKCKKEFTVYRSIKELEKNDKFMCPHCKSDNVHRKLSTFFAKTDSKA
jgi:putative FmdB family regulatory protein